MVTYCYPYLISAYSWLMHIFSKDSLKTISRMLLRFYVLNFQVIIAIFLLGFTFNSKANEQISEERYGSNESYINNSGDPNSPIIKDDFEWQIMIDLSLVYQPEVLKSVKQTEVWHFLEAGLLIDLSYKGFFLQTNQRRSATILGGVELGYQLLVKDSWQIDIIAKGYMSGYDADNLIKYQDADEELFAGLSQRNDTVGIGLRYSSYFDNAIFTLDIASAHAEADINGLIIDSFYSYLLPYRNWDIYLGAGLTYYDQALIDYYIGIDEFEATKDRPQYTANSGYRGQLEIYAQHPLSSNWSFNVGITQSFYNNEIKKSPLVDKNKLTQVMLGVLYVF